MGTHFHARLGTKTTPVFLPTDGEASWSLLPYSISPLSDGTMQGSFTQKYSSVHAIISPTENIGKN